MRHNAGDADSVYSHTPVLWREIIEFVDSSLHRGSGRLIDCTLGEGGHTEILLKRYPELEITAFERDTAILERAKERLKPFGERVEFINDNFSEISEHLSGRSDINYMLYDFGISSYHFDMSGRGFSLAKDEPLDMRLSDSLEYSAADIINTYDEKSLADIFYTLGEERWSRKIAAYICNDRQKKRIETTSELASIVMRAIPRRFHVKNIHPATRVFQALRIAVNDELSAIERSLDDAFRLISLNGRIMAISFHSLEDRIVKNRFRDYARGCTCHRPGELCGCDSSCVAEIITRKPVVPSPDEIEENRRSRSAKLRVCEKVERRAGY